MAAAELRDFSSQYPERHEGIRPKAFENYIQGYKEYYESSEVKIEAKKIIDEFISKSQINLDVVPKEKRDALKSFSQLILNRIF